MTNILFLTEGEHVPSTRYRVMPMLSYFQEAGFSCTVRHCSPNKYLVSKRRWFWPVYEGVTTLGRLWQIRDARKFDIIFLQRDLVRWESSWLEKWLHTMNPNIIFDIDDAQWLFSSNEKIRAIAQMSRFICAGNNNLREFFSPVESEFIPTVVDVASYPKKQHQEVLPVIIGWTGTSFNYPFFDGMRPLFESLLIPGKVEMHIISNGGEVAELSGLPVHYKKWSPESELSDLVKFDIGIMPLPNTELTRYKCGLKLVQYMAAGIPSVAAPIGANSEIVIHEETGFLCENLTEWQHQLEKLIDSRLLRDKMGQAARDRAETHYNAAVVAKKLISLFHQIS